MTPATQERKLALFPIIDTLFQLIAERAEVEADAEMDEEERSATLDGIGIGIEKYFTDLENKVDGMAYIDRELIVHAETDEKEGKRLLARAKGWERARDNFRDRIARTMQATGQTRLPGVHNTLAIQRNPASVDVRQPEIVPNEYKRVIVKVDARTWNLLMTMLATMEHHRAQQLYMALREAWTLDPTLEHGVMKTAALPELKKQGPCPECKGTGNHEFTSIEDEAGHISQTYETCEPCKGTGKVYIGAVPGLALITDQVHLRIR